MTTHDKHPMSVSALLGQSGSGRGGICRTAKVKAYPDGSLEVLACDKPIFLGEGREALFPPETFL